jgi:hypothetical protein
LGSAITYQRRYALGAILCLNIDEDDDAERASQPLNLTAGTRSYDDGREWMSESQYLKTVERFKNGETDIIDKAIATFKMRRELREQLLALKNNHYNQSP